MDDIGGGGFPIEYYSFSCCMITIILMQYMSTMHYYYILMLCTNAMCKCYILVIYIKAIY